MTKCKAILVALAVLTLNAFCEDRLAYADSTSPRLAAYYDLKMLLCGETAYQWRAGSRPQPVATNVVQVGVGRDAGYALTRTGDLLTWQDDPAEMRRLLDRVS